MTDLSLGLHGAYLRSDLVLELGEHALRVALRGGLLAQPWRGVIVESERSVRLETRAAAATLKIGPDGVLSRQTAVALHGCLAAADCRDVHMTLPAASRIRGRPGLVVHRGWIADEDITTRMELPVQVLDLAMAELLCAGPRRLALACVDQALAAMPADQREQFRDEVSDRLAERQDRRGTVRGEVLLSLATGMAESPPESWLRLLVADAGLPTPVPQYEVLDVNGELVYRLDLAWPELRIALEYDGFDAHEGRVDADAERDRRLEGRGWLVVRVRAADLKAPDRVLGDLRGAFRLRSRVV